MSVWTLRDARMSQIWAKNGRKLIFLDMKKEASKYMKDVYYSQDVKTSMQSYIAQSLMIPEVLSKLFGKVDQEFLSQNPNFSQLLQKFVQMCIDSSKRFYTKLLDQLGSKFSKYLKNSKFDFCQILMKEVDSYQKFHKKLHADLKSTSFFEVEKGLLKSQNLIFECLGKNFGLDDSLNLEKPVFNQYKAQQIYRGEYKNGLFFGTGKEFSSQGDFYEGDFKHGKFDGLGKMISKEGHFYKGMWSAGKPTGEGTMLLSSGVIYQGEWEAGKPSGLGKQIFTNGEFYEGEFKNGSFSGKGVRIFNNGDIYEGQFSEGKFNGEGKLTSKQGHYFEGRFRNGKPDTYGTLICKNGSRYQGEWSNGEIHGQGVKVINGKNTFEGVFNRGLLEGPGKAEFEDGSRYEGEWKLGKFHGKGKLVYSTGEVYQGAFVKGKRCGKGRQDMLEGRFLEGDFKEGYVKGCLYIPEKGMWSGEFDLKLKPLLGRCEFFKMVRVGSGGGEEVEEGASSSFKKKKSACQVGDEVKKGEGVVGDGDELGDGRSGAEDGLVDLGESVTTTSTVQSITAKNRSSPETSASSKLPTSKNQIETPRDQKRAKETKEDHKEFSETTEIALIPSNQPTTKELKISSKEPSKQVTTPRQKTHGQTSTQSTKPTNRKHHQTNKRKSKKKRVYESERNSKKKRLREKKRKAKENRLKKKLSKLKHYQDPQSVSGSEMITRQQSFIIEGGEMKEMVDMKHLSCGALKGSSEAKNKVKLVLEHNSLSINGKKLSIVGEDSELLSKLINSYSGKAKGEGAHGGLKGLFKLIESGYIESGTAEFEGDDYWGDQVLREGRDLFSRFSFN